MEIILALSINKKEEPLMSLTSDGTIFLNILLNKKTNYYANYLLDIYATL